MALTARYDEALAYASELHRNQVRKGTDIPYLSHLLSVSALVMEHGGSEDQAIAALLHDAAEDQGGRDTLETIRTRFGDDVARMVAECTDSWTKPKPPWRERKEAYLESLPRKHPDSLLIALADKTHNSRTIRANYRTIGDAVWDRFKGGREGTLWYYRSLADFFAEAMPGPLSRELSYNVRVFSGE